MLHTLTHRKRKMKYQKKSTDTPARDVTVPLWHERWGRSIVQPVHTVGRPSDKSWSSGEAVQNLTANALTKLWAWRIRPILEGLSRSSSSSNNIHPGRHTTSSLPSWLILIIREGEIKTNSSDIIGKRRGKEAAREKTRKKSGREKFTFSPLYYVTVRRRGKKGKQQGAKQKQITKMDLIL